MTTRAQARRADEGFSRKAPRDLYSGLDDPELRSMLKAEARSEDGPRAKPGHHDVRQAAARFLSSRGTAVRFGIRPGKRPAGREEAWED